MRVRFMTTPLRVTIASADPAHQGQLSDRLGDHQKDDDGHDDQLVDVRGVDHRVVERGSQLRRHLIRIDRSIERRLEDLALEGTQAAPAESSRGTARARRSPSATPRPTAEGLPPTTRGCRGCSPPSIPESRGSVRRDRPPAPDPAPCRCRWRRAPARSAGSVRTSPATNKNADTTWRNTRNDVPLMTDVLPPPMHPRSP